jgi:hypothetical protein
VQAESRHRGHTVIEQVFADLIDRPLAHLPSAAFNANAAWPQPAVTAHALTRALAPSPPPATPRPAAPPSTPNSSRSPHVPRATDATRSPGTYPSTGPGSLPGSARTRPPTARHPPSQPDPDHRPPRPDRKPQVDKLDARPAATTRPRPVDLDRRSTTPPRK